MMAALERHTGAGRLTLDEFTQRVGLAADATTLDELSAVVSDLPADDQHRRDFLILLLVAVVTLALLAGFLVLR